MTSKLFSTCTVHSSFKKLQAVLNFGNVSSGKFPGKFEIPISHVELCDNLNRECVSRSLRFNRLSLKFKL